MLISKDFRFDAAHSLPFHDGKCSRLHGHTYKMTVWVRGDLYKDGPKAGMVADYGDISIAVKPVIDEYLDHHHLNETVMTNPTAENLAMWVYEKLENRIPGLWAIAISETCTTSAIYAPHCGDFPLSAGGGILGGC